MSGVPVALVAAVALAAPHVVGAQSAGTSLSHIGDLVLVTEDAVSGTVSVTDQIVVATTARGVAASVTVPAAGIEPDSIVTAASIPDAGDQFTAAGVRPPGGLEFVAAMTVAGRTANGLPLPTPFPERVSIGFELPPGFVPAAVETGTFELGAWDGVGWTLLVPAVTAHEDGTISVRDRVEFFSAMYAVFYVPTRLAGTPRPGSIALLVATVRSEPLALIEALTGAGCDVATISLLRGNRWRTYIHGAPEVINEPFPSAALAQEPFFVRCW